MSNAIHIELDAICLLILCMIVWQSTHNVNQQMRIIHFRNVLYGIMTILVLDIIWFSFQSCASYSQMCAWVLDS